MSTSEFREQSLTNKFERARDFVNRASYYKNLPTEFKPRIEGDISYDEVAEALLGAFDDMINDEDVEIEGFLNAAPVEAFELAVDYLNGVDTELLRNSLLDTPFERRDPVVVALEVASRAGRKFRNGEVRKPKSKEQFISPDINDIISSDQLSETIPKYVDVVDVTKRLWDEGRLGDDEGYAKGLLMLFDDRLIPDTAPRDLVFQVRLEAILKLRRRLNARAGDDTSIHAQYGFALLNTYISDAEKRHFTVSIAQFSRLTSTSDPTLALMDSDLAERIVMSHMGLALDVINF